MGAERPSTRGLRAKDRALRTRLRRGRPMARSTDVLSERSCKVSGAQEQYKVVGEWDYRRWAEVD